MNTLLKEKSSEQKITKKHDFPHIAGMIFTALIPIYLFIILEYIHFGTFGKIWTFLTTYHGPGLFSLLLLYGLYLLMWCACKKGVIASFIMTALCSALAVINYFKHTLTGDFLYPWDIVNQAGNMGELSGFVKNGLPIGSVIIILIGFLLVVGTYFARADIRIRARWRGIICAVTIAVLVIPLSTFQIARKTLSLFNMDISNISNQEINHSAHGFTGGFLVNLLSTNVPAPDGYSGNTINSILAPYAAKAADASFAEPDIIVILSESFWDPKLLPNTSFSKNPIANFEAVSKRKNAFSGNMYLTTQGGGTVRTEFDVITGLTVDQLPAGSVPWQYVTGNIPSYPSHYRDMGYRTVFMHTYGSSFYMRNKAYPFIGFDELYFEEDLTAIDDIKWQYSGNYLSDDTFVSYIEYLLDRDSEKPCFLFGISMENHQPYINKYEKPAISVSNSGFSTESQIAVENYTTGVYMSDLALKRLVDYIDKRDKETVLIYFGDHLPTLGTDKAAYVESGFISADEMTDNEWRSLLRAPFLIYSNFETKDSEMLKHGEVNEISSYNLINAASELIGAPTTPLMKFLSDYYEAIPFYNYRLKITPSEEQNHFITSHKLLTYDVMNGKQYSVK